MYPSGYSLLKKSFKKLGFTHRQGSGYISKEKLDSDQINDIMGVIMTENPWLGQCAKKVDVTDIGRQHDLMPLIKERSVSKNGIVEPVGQAELAKPARQAEQVKQAKQAEQVGQAEQSKESKFSSREDQINSLMSVCKRQLSNEIARDQAQEQRQAEQARQAEQVGQVRQAGAKSSGAKGKGKAPRGK